MYSKKGICTVKQHQPGQKGSLSNSEAVRFKYSLLKTKLTKRVQKQKATMRLHSFPEHHGSDVTGSPCSSQSLLPSVFQAAALSLKLSNSSPSQFFCYNELSCGESPWRLPWVKCGGPPEEAHTQSCESSSASTTLTFDQDQISCKAECSVCSSASQKEAPRCQHLY